MADTENPAPAGDAPAGTDDAANSGGVHVPTKDEILNFRCDCFMDFLPLWEKALDLIEGVVPINMCCHCCIAFVAPINLRLTTRIIGLNFLITGIQGLLYGIDLFAYGGLALLWAIIYIGIALTMIWGGYLLWFGGAFNDNDRIAIFLNVEAWIIMLTIGFGLFIVLTVDGIDFGWWIQTSLSTFISGVYTTCQVVKFYRIVKDKADATSSPCGVGAEINKFDEWDDDAKNTGTLGCCTWCPLCGGGGGGGGDGAKAAESEPA
jgi:hypothetical protein